MKNNTASQSARTTLTHYARLLKSEECCERNGKEMSQEGKDCLENAQPKELLCENIARFSQVPNLEIWMTEDEQIKEHVCLVVKKSGVNLPISFVEKTVTNSTGCFKGDSFEIEFNIPQLRYEKERQEKLGNPFPSLLHLADLIISHELGHAKDQKKRNYVSKIQQIKQNIWQEANAFNPINLKKYCQLYAINDYEIEQKAWEYAHEFALLSHNEETVKAYVRFCLNSYEKFYPYHFKMHLYALRLMEQWEKKVHSMDNQVFNYTIIEGGFTSYNKRTKQLEINIPNLIRKKPKELRLSPNHYAFFKTLYILAKGKIVSDELEGKIGRLLISIKRKGYSEQDRYEMEILSEKKRNETHEAFSFMESHLKQISSSYLQFKAYMLNDLEEDLKDNFTYIEDMANLYQNKKQVS